MADLLIIDNACIALTYDDHEIYICCCLLISDISERFGRQPPFSRGEIMRQTNHCSCVMLCSCVMQEEATLIRAKTQLVFIGNIY